MSNCQIFYIYIVTELMFIMYTNYADIPYKPKENLLGKTFGELTVLGYILKNNGRRNEGYYVCECSCGSTVEIRGNKVRDRIACHACSCSLSAKQRKGGLYTQIKNYSRLKRKYELYKRRAQAKQLPFNIDIMEFINT